MTTQGKQGIAGIDFNGLFDDLSRQFTFIDCIRECIDNSIDAKATTVKVIIKPNMFCIADNGDGMTHETICNKLLWFYSPGNYSESKIGSKGIGLKASTSKLSNKNNITIYTKTKQSSEKTQINMCHKDVITAKDIKLYNCQEIGSSHDKKLNSLSELDFCKDHGTIVYSDNPEVCKYIIDNLKIEATDADLQFQEYITQRLNHSYSGFMSTHPDFVLNCIFDNVSRKCTNLKLFEFGSIFEEIKVKCLDCKSDKNKIFFVKFPQDAQWKRVTPTSDSQKLLGTPTETVNETFQIAKNSGTSVFEFSIYWWFNFDPKEYNKICELADTVSEKQAHAMFGGFYSYRENKFSDRGFKLKVPRNGDFSSKNIYSGSVWVLKFSSMCDVLFNTGINKSHLDISERSYFYKCITETAEAYCKIKNNLRKAQPVDQKPVDQVETKQTPIDTKSPVQEPKKVTVKEPEPVQEPKKTTVKEPVKEPKKQTIVQKIASVLTPKSSQKKLKKLVSPEEYKRLFDTMTKDSIDSGLTDKQWMDLKTNALAEAQKECPLEKLLRTLHSRSD